jgi:two-component system, LytTR family, sensor kinase
LVENAFKYVGGDYQLDIIMKWENNRISLFIRTCSQRFLFSMP